MERYTGQAKAEAVGTKVVIAAKSAVAAACEWVAAAGMKRCGFDAANTTVAGLDVMRKALPAKLRRGMFVAAGPLVGEDARGEGLGRDCEDAVRRLGWDCGLFEGMLTYLESGLTERQVAAGLEYAASWRVRRE